MPLREKKRNHQKYLSSGAFRRKEIGDTLTSVALCSLSILMRLMNGEMDLSVC